VSFAKPNVASEPVLVSLSQRASARFAWQWRRVAIAQREAWLAVASDPEAMLLQACHRQDAGEQGVIDPFWAATWRAAAGLDQYLDRVELSGVRVLEVGCGTGFAGFAAGLRGANVTLTDGVCDPLLLVQMSVWPIRERTTVRRLRFGLDQLHQPRFPLIIGSDVTYLRNLWPQLDECLRTHLTAKGAVLLSDPYRVIGNEFRDWIQGRGWRYEETRIDLNDDPEHPIRVMRIQLTSANFEAS
jgi:predicted nicotinamide N-methyase